MVKIRHLLLIVLLTWLGPLAAVGQEGMYAVEGEEPHLFRGGIVLGTNFSQVDGDSYYGYHKVGLHVGAMVYANLSPNFGISMEMLYSRKGSYGVRDTISPVYGEYFAKYFMSVNYVEVPLMLHLVARRLDFELGVSYAYLVSSDEYIISDQPVFINPEACKFNSSDLDFNVGTTMKVYKNLFVNLRYQYSLISIRPPERIPVGYSYGNRGQFNNLFNLRLEYLF